MRVVVSACLLGECCKYSGGNNLHEELVRALAGHEVVPVCPEVRGGLPIPRPPAEIRDGRVVTAAGESVDDAFRAGVAGTLADLEGRRIDCAVLQSRSPSCGVNRVYDGTFTGALVPGRGLFAAALAERGVRVVDVEDFDASMLEG